MNACYDARAVLLISVLFAGTTLGCELSPKEELGARIFKDQALSQNQNQSCASCHSKDTGGTGGDYWVNAHGAVYEGSVSGRFGNRKPPATTYATLAPRLDYEPSKGFIGGNFWDGRATGWTLGSPAAEQAQGPFLNPVEQGLPNATALVHRVCRSTYGELFRSVWGKESCSDIEKGYVDIALSIAAFEDSDWVNQFSSKYDDVRRGQANLSKLESKGKALFEGKALCANCHVTGGSGKEPLFTDFGFDNLGIPKNPENPFYAMDKVLIDGISVNPLGDDWIDPGLGGFLETLAAESSWRTLPYVPASILEMSEGDLKILAMENYGKHRVPTLRNVDKRPNLSFVKAYGHNGYFKSLKSIVHFYNTRDVLPVCNGAYTEAQALAANCWPPPEVTENVTQSGIGNLGLTNHEEDAIVAFLSTLSDTRTP